MTADLTLEEAAALALRNLMRDAFPGVQCVSWDSPEEREKVNIAIRIDSLGEQPIGSGMHDVSIAVRATNLDAREREVMRTMLGNSRESTDLIREAGRGLFSMPRGQAVDVAAISHETENQTDRIASYTLTATLQPIY